LKKDRVFSVGWLLFVLALLVGLFYVFSRFNGGVVLFFLVVGLVAFYILFMRVIPDDKVIR